ncbi:alpha/beta hydrolase fold domain-containing protein [Nocardia veterana]|uniref:Alpha/beta hydrolase n=1 Tax=Nocardia veterana TaxID=132249 RepID=A0A7X6LY32_9NOCA|nr:alpha/beta hydrolase [Nocardia veterana]NKY86657.1 alpha/beta hydrolase [Nocardia veterana]
MYDRPPVLPVNLGKPSLRSRMMIAALRVTRAKKTFADVDALHESIPKSQRPERDSPPAEVHLHHWVTRRVIRGRPVYTLRPQYGGSRRHVLYLHGGAYVHQIQHDHWTFLSRLIDRTGCTVTVPLYPLAPGCHAEDTVAMVRAAHAATFAGTASEDTVFMGDSAGAALALVLARTARAPETAAPKEVVLISPWLDVTMSDPMSAELDPCDPYLGIAGLVEAGRLYAGRLDPRDPRISPLNAPTATPGRLSLFVGTRDILLADARRFRSRCADEGTELDYYEYPGMIHAWHIADIPEARHALRELVHIVQRPARV